MRNFASANAREGYTGASVRRTAHRNGQDRGQNNDQERFELMC